MMTWIVSHSDLVLWAVFAVIFLIIEAMTVSTVSLWFVGGCVAALILAAVGGPIWLQLLGAAAVSGILFGAFWRHRGKITGKQEITEEEDMTGKTGVVSQTIPAGGIGQICIDDVYWNAQAIDDAIEIPEGKKVIVVRTEGIRCIVESNDFLT